MPTSRVERNLADYFAEAITNDYLITIAVTSYTQAKYQTKNLPFGLGKTTLCMELSYLLNGGSINDGFQRKDIWEKVHEAMVYDPYSMGKLLEPGRERLFCSIWDDPQATAPATQSVPKAIRQLANFISTERPEVACIFLATPNLNYISAPLRKLVNFEIIISERGLYEVHKISYYKNFKKPLQDNMRFDYIDEIARDQPFPPLPDFEQKWYETWRVEQKKLLYPSMMKNLKVYTNLRQWIEEDDSETIELNLKCAKIAGNQYGAIIPADLGRTIHGEEVMLTVRKPKAIVSP